MTANAFIFARGGSKGLPRKNIKILNGKPLICHSIDVAFACNEFDQVYVSTDCDEISAISKAAGATVIKRPVELAGDESPEWLAWQHAITYVFNHYGEFDEFVSLPATSPLRSKEDVTLAMRKRGGQQADLCIAITPANRSPYFNMVKVANDGQLELVNKPETKVNRRQDAPKVFDITTVVYASTTEFILNNTNMFDGKIVGIEVPKERAVDIDDIYDFMLAEAISTNVDGNI